MSDAELRIGSLCSGYGGLDLAAEYVLDAETIWHAEIAAAPARVLAERWPGVPNHGDLTRIDWHSVAPVDVITAGYPCQPFSAAGRRKGETDERHIWPYIREGIRELRPALTILENVPGHRSLGFDRVLGDLAEDGFNAEWVSLRASDVGAAHRRERLFILAYAPNPRGDRCPRGPQRDVWPPGQLEPSLGRDADRRATARQARDLAARWQAPPDTRGKEFSRWARLRASDEGALWRQRSSDGNHAGRAAGPAEFPWGEYRPRIERWGAIVGRGAPRPVVRGPAGGKAVSARFIEWHMGLPEGWVTDVQGVGRAAAIEALGNGVVPQQAIAAIVALLTSSLDSVANSARFTRYDDQRARPAQ